MAVSVGAIARSAVVRTGAAGAYRLPGSIQYPKLTFMRCRTHNPDLTLNLFPLNYRPSLPHSGLQQNFQP
jgi:hypothetical protein